MNDSPFFHAGFIIGTWACERTLRMAKIPHFIGGALLGLGILAHAQKLDESEVRITYGELKQLLSRAEPPQETKAHPPALLSARLRLSLENDLPIIHATYRIYGFSDVSALVPLIEGDVSLESQQPDEAVVVAEDHGLSLVSSTQGAQMLQLRLLPLLSENEFSITIPPCPAVIFETGDIPTDQSVVLLFGDREETLGAGKIQPLPNHGQAIRIRLLGSSETREALSPPEPSTWTWQQQALVLPSEGEHVYQVLARASATNGSGVEAVLPLPPDAQDITATGDDLVSQTKIRGENRSLSLSLVWKTRSVLDRQLMISYRMPFRLLDHKWKLHAPGDEGTRTRFIIARSPLLDYAAEGLSGPVSSQALPSALATHLKGASCYQLEGVTSAEISATPIPVAATEEGVIKSAEWSLKIEPDGSMLATGALTIEHKGPLDFRFDTPQNMKLLACELQGSPVLPIDLGEGRLKISLLQVNSESLVHCSFTSAGSALDPVSGTLQLSLPQTPLFLHSLLWNIDLPYGYQAETHGNLTRLPSTGGTASRITLRKNLCRNERPEVQVFYQRSDLNR